MKNNTSFTDELVLGMHRQLIRQDMSYQEVNELIRAAEYLNSAAEIFEDIGMVKNSDQILNILYKIAQHHTPRNPEKISDRHTKGLTPGKMVNNLKHHGTMFNLNDDGKKTKELLNQHVEDTLEVSDGISKELEDFEDEL